MEIFSMLHKDIKGVVDKLGLRNPTLAQKKAIPQILTSDEDIIIVAPTGAGKTEAAILPVLSKMLERGELNPFTFIYVTPLRSLNRDIFYRLKRILTDLGISVDIRHSDTPDSIRRRQTKKPPIVLVTTPETLNILLWAPKLRRFLANVRYVVIDEIHEVSDSKRGVQLSLVLERIRLLSRDFQLILLSATVSNPLDVLKYYTRGKGGIVIHTGESKNYEIRVRYVAPKIEKSFGMAIIRPNFRWLGRIIESILSKARGKVLVFTNTRDMAEALGNFLKRTMRHRIGIHHSSIARELRVKVEKGLKMHDIDLAVATSSLELGIDIGNIEHVVQVNSPRRVEVALQRIGRSGHFIERTSRGTILTISIDDFLEALSIALLAKEGIVEPVNLIYKSYDVLAHQVVGIVRDYKFDKGEYPALDEVYRIVRRAYPYKDLSMEEFLAVCRFLEKKSRGVRIMDGRLGLRRGSIRLYFRNLSMIPHSPKYRVIDVATKKLLGELDEKYVLELNVGDKFILGGKCREVLRVDQLDREVVVKTIKDVSSPPSWVGELLPVSYIVARKVAVLRKKIFAGEIEELRTFAYAKDIRIVEKVLQGGKIIPDENVILVEYEQLPLSPSVVVMNACFGDEVNRILGMLVFRVLLEYTSLPVVGYATDPYRILIQLYSMNITDEDIRNAVIKAFRILGERHDDLEAFVRDTVRKDTKSLFWYFLNVARRFNLIDEESVSREKIRFLMEKFRDSILMEEAVNEFLNTKADLKNLKKVIEKIKTGRIELWIRRGLSSLSIPNFVLADTAELGMNVGTRLAKYKERLLRRRIKWLCLQCGYSEILRVADAGWSKCPECGSRIITVSKPFDFSEFIVEKLKRGMELTPSEKNRIDVLFSIGMMLRKYPKLTKIVVAASGVNLQQALSILRHGYDEWVLLETLQELEARFIKSQVFG